MDLKQAAVNYNFIENEVMDKMRTDLISELDNFVIEGLRMKGFEFRNKKELESFIANRCKCEDYVDKGERVYFVDETPFVLHRYKEELGAIPQIKNNYLTMNYGYIGYL